MSTQSTLSRPFRSFQPEPAQEPGSGRRSQSKLQPAGKTLQKRSVSAALLAGAAARAPRHRLLVRLGLLDGRPLPGLDR